MSKMKEERKKHMGWKIVLIVLAVLLILVGIILAGAWSMFGTQVKAASSVKKLDDGLYYMDYDGDYGFARFLEQGGASNVGVMANYITEFLSHGFVKTSNAQAQERNYGCSTLYLENKEGGYLMGRNFDWTKCNSVMIVHTKSKDAYESYSTCNMDFLGFGEDWKPEGFANQYMAIAAIYVPLDGMNEKGLMIADLMAGDLVETHQNTEKPDLTTTTAIRAMLDYAANVDEAIALLEKYDMNSDIGSAHHYAISDASGRSVTVEWVNNEMVVTETDTLTNHYLAEAKYGIGNELSKTRMETMKQAKADKNGVMTQTELQEVMKSVSQGNYVSNEATQWTVLYNTKEMSLEYFWQENYERSETFYIGNN